MPAILDILDWGVSAYDTINRIGNSSAAQLVGGPPVPVTPIYPIVGAPGGDMDVCRGVPRRRRRRRRLLTESDYNDLMRIATLPNKQNVAVALAKAIGRR